jgi:hypothetical protein
MDAILSPGFLDAVIDAICPGLDGGRPVPSATAAGLSREIYALPHTVVLAAIAGAAGGEAAFQALPPQARAEVLARVEAADATAFRALVQAVIADFYEAPAVLAAFGWRSDPPQPRGRTLEPMDDGLDTLIARVTARGPVWRKAE